MAEVTGNRPGARRWLWAALASVLAVGGVTAASVESLAIADDPAQLSPGSQRFDPVESARNFRAGAKASGGKALRMVQFSDTPRDAWRGALASSDLMAERPLPAAGERARPQPRPSIRLIPGAGFRIRHSRSGAADCAITSYGRVP